MAYPTGFTTAVDGVTEIIADHINKLEIKVGIDTDTNPLSLDYRVVYLETNAALLPGRAGGQTLKGGTGASENLTLQSTAHATKGKILFGTSAYDEVNDRLGIGTTTPNNKIQVAGLISFDDTLFNIFLGYQAGNVATGDRNTFIGYQSGYANTTGQYNTAVGQKSLLSNTIGTSNTAIGSSALRLNTTGNENVALGNNTLYNNVTGSYNVAVGRSALQTQWFGEYNTAIGYNALNQGDGKYNTAVGYCAMETQGAGSSSWYNSAFGVYALRNSTATHNTAIGYSALYTNVSGNNNVALGYQAGYYETESNKLFIDNQQRASEADARLKALVYGVFDAAVANQIFTVNAKLDVAGDMRSTGFMEHLAMTVPAAPPADSMRVYVKASGVSPNREVAYCIKDETDGEMIVTSILV